jgi:hypothetical protein
VNTQDVLPYATVLPDRPERMVYLYRTDRDTRGLTVEQVQDMAYPEGMPALRQHMERLKPLLLEIVRGYGSRRPWWEVHNHRPAIVEHDCDPDESPWADYALMARWGGGGRLVAGLAPAGSVPASGLQVVIPDHVPASYIVGVINSSMGQELAEQLPPGVMQQQLVEAMPLPFLPDVAEQIAAKTEKAAGLVARMIRMDAPHWPALRDALRDDISLSELPTGIWFPKAGHATSRGPVQGVSWVNTIHKSGAQSGRIERVTIEHDLHGPSVKAWAGNNSVSVVSTVDDDNVLDALSRHLQGAACKRMRLSDVPRLQIPIDPDEYRATVDEHQSDLESRTSAYRACRADIDRLLAWSPD